MKLQFALKGESYKYEYGIAGKEIEMDEISGYNEAISLETARNDWTAFQLLLRADEDFTLSTGGNPYFSPRGPLDNVRIDVQFNGLPGAKIFICPVGSVEDDDRIFRSDILLEHENVYVKTPDVQPVWVEIGIPADAVPGTYDGEARIYRHRMFETEEMLSILPFKIRVRNVLLDAPRDYRFHLALWLHMANIARKHETALWSDSHFEVLEHYVKSLAELGQKSVMIFASEIPWSGQRCYRNVNYLSDLFEYSMLKVKKNKAGVYSIDFSAMERFIKLCFEYGIDREIEIHGLLNIWFSEMDGYRGPVSDYPDDIRIRYFDESDQCFKYMNKGEDIRNYIRSLEAFFAEKGWVDKVRITADEPADVQIFKTRVEELKRAAPRMKIKLIIAHPEFIDNLNYFIKQEMDFVIYIETASQKWRLLPDIMKDMKGRVVFYVCCGPEKPNTFISSPLLECRLMGIIAAYTGFDGFLRWNYTVWPEKPRERMSYKYPVWKAGDTNFVYPSYNGRPFLTLRYKNLKRGIEDYDLIRRVKESCRDAGDLMDRIKSKIFRLKDPGQYYNMIKKNAAELYSLDQKDYDSMRALLLDALEGCTHST